MTEDPTPQKQAQTLWERAYQQQMRGKLSDAIQLYKESLAKCPTAEAFTFLGWAYSMIGLHEEAIALCKQAIELDPEFGNPYNDIGAYMMELDQWDEAIPWLEEAIAAPRYASPQFPYLNLGRVYEHLGDVHRALVCYQQALTIAPLYLPAEWAKNGLIGKLN